MTQLDEEFVFNPLCLSSNLYQHLRSRGLQSQPRYPYRSGKVNATGVHRNLLNDKSLKTWLKKFHNNWNCRNGGIKHIQINLHIDLNESLKGKSVDPLSRCLVAIIPVCYKCTENKIKPVVFR